MPRSLALPMLSHLQGSLLSLAQCIRIERADGQVFGFTSLDRNLVIDGLTYQAFTSVGASTMRQSEGTGVDNLEVHGILTSDQITDGDLLAGVWDGAEVSLFQTNYLDLTMGTIPLLTGTLGEITRREGEWITEIRGLVSRLGQQVGIRTSPTCRVKQLGDAECQAVLGPIAITSISQSANAVVVTATAHGYRIGQRVYFANVGGMTQINQANPTIVLTPSAVSMSVALDSTGFSAYTSGGQLGFRFTRTVASVTSPTVLTFAAEPSGSGFFNYGRVQFTSGPNLNWQREVKSHVLSGGQAVLTLQEAFPYLPAVGNTAVLEAGCDRTFVQCVNRYGNAKSFAGEPHIPSALVILRRGKRGGEHSVLNMIDAVDGRRL